MISKIHIQNFRSIGQIKPIELGKITVLTGANNSGKSSILYGLMILQDFLRNPNRSLEDLFALPFINLGGFSEVKSKFDALNEYIDLGITAEQESNLGAFGVSYRLFLGAGKTFIKLSSDSGPFSFEARMSIGLPYVPVTETYQKAQFKRNDTEILFGWNGFTASLKPRLDVFSELEESIISALQTPVNELFATDFAPISRNFTKPYYNMVPMRGIIQTEEEVATMLKSEPATLEAANQYLEKITGRTLELPGNGTPGLFSLLARNAQSGQTNFLVNEGSGTNQVVTLLAKIFQPGKQFICIDEPEIHLHPGMVRSLAASFADMVSSDPKRQFLVSTHSEHFVQALMAKVAAGSLRPEDVKVYHLSITETGTAVEHQSINSKGQLEGGLSHFFAEELKSVKSFFKLTD